MGNDDEIYARRLSLARQGALMLKKWGELAACKTLEKRAELVAGSKGCLDLLPSPGANAVCSLFSKLAARKAWRRLATPINSKQIN